MDLFDHQVAFRCRKYAKNPAEHKISDVLMCSPRNKHQRMLMEVDYASKVEVDVMNDVHVGHSKKKAASVRLDNLGQIKSHSCFVNNPERMERLKTKLGLMRSIGRVDEGRAMVEANKLNNDRLQLASILAEAIRLFKV